MGRRQLPRINVENLLSDHFESLTDYAENITCDQYHLLCKTDFYRRELELDIDLIWSIRMQCET